MRNDERRPAAHETPPKTTATRSAPSIPAPAWSVPVVEAVTQAWADGYALGVAHGRAEAVEDHRRAVLHAQAAEVVRNAAQDIGTPAASRSRGWAA